MSATSKLLTAALLTLLAGTALAADYAGPTLDGSVTLRSGETISGIILAAQLGIVDGAEIGSSLRDGGYIAVRVDGEERRIDATEVAAIDAEWAEVGTDNMVRWKITSLVVTTTSGEVITGTPAWLVHATRLEIEQPDGSVRKVYAFPMASSNFSPDNLLTHLTVGEGAPAPAEEAAAPAEEATAPAEEAAAPAEEAAAPAEEAAAPAEEAAAPAEEAAAPAEEAAAPAEEAAAPAEETAAPAEEAAAPAEETAAPAEGAPEATVAVVAAPTVEPVPEGSVFASGQPAVVTFELINPETGNPMKVRFLIVPLPAGE